MIVSHQLSFVFAAIPKTGTHSVRRALRQHLGPDDLEQVQLFERKLFPDPAMAAIRHGHITLQQVRGFLGEEAFARYCKFAFVRNPFDRFVSYCSFATRQGGEFDRDPQGVMRALVSRPPLQHVLFQPQCTFIVAPDGAMLADEIGRVETMQASYDAIAARLGVASTSLEQVNSSRRGQYRDYYDQPLIDAVTALYKRDLDLFGYTF